jgi:hypothetical protein
MSSEFRIQNSELAGAPSFIALDDGEAMLTAHCEERVDCPICNQSLPVFEFGVCKGRTTGRNLYCKSCINKKVGDARRGLKTYRETRKAQKQQGALPLIGLAPITFKRLARRDANGILIGDEILNSNYAHRDRVLAAIHQGSRTQKEIVAAITGRPASQKSVAEMDHVGDSLASLMFCAPPLVKTSVIAGLRVYVPVAVSSGDAGSAAAGSAGILPASERSEQSFSFSTLGGIVAPKSDRSTVVGHRSASWRAA